MYIIIISLLIIVSIFAIHRNNDADKYRDLWIKSHDQEKDA